MEFTAALPPQITSALQRSSIVLTGNQRAARTLRHSFDLNQRAINVAYWQPPAILAWDAWLNNLWKQLLIEGHATDLLLNPAQEQTLWRAIIAADTTTASLRPVDALAETAAHAWQLLHAYRGRRLLHTYPGNTDTRAFARWAIEFERRCNKSQYLSQAELPEFLRTALAAGHITTQVDILLVGFDSQTPAQTALLEALREFGTSVEDLDKPPLATSINLAAASDNHAELTTCASWIRKLLTDQPGSRIAVIVPAIESSREEIDRVFRQILAPELNFMASPSGTGPYEFSLGIPLAHTPLVATALDTLRWTLGALPLERICTLLLSPHFAASTPDSSSELLARAEFDAFVLRDQPLLQPEMSLDALYKLMSDSRHRTGLPNLLKHLATLRQLFFAHKDLATTRRTHADWAAAIHDLLDASGWAISSHLDSIEFQTRRKWESALDELATLDFDGVRLPFSDALAALERIASETLFAPESRHAPVQIMGPLESAGSSFDAVWFLRANDLEWPSTPATNPLLPWFLQRELAMPGAEPARDAAHFRRITERIAASAPTVLFSYAQESVDGRQRVSSTLAGLALHPRDASEIAPEVTAHAPIELDSAIDDTPIPPPPDRVLQGGAGILQSQAACGFRAFAEKRLFASALESASLGLDPRERGSLVHAVLENFWAEVKDQATLKAMPREERVAQLNRSIDIAFSRDYVRRAAGWPRAYIDAEHQRLLSLLLDWLQFEDECRKPFAVKQREEKLSDVSIGPLRLDIRVDRIDTNLSAGEPGGDIILDYKTGAATPRDWLGLRPDAPQLPLYAVVTNNTNLAAVAFASVRPGTLVGIAGYEAGGDGQSGILPKAATLKAASLAAQVDEWREVLTSLAEQFHAGNFSVLPKHYPQTCQYCEQRLLCRLNPSALDPDILEETEEESDAFATKETDFV